MKKNYLFLYFIFLEVIGHVRSRPPIVVTKTFCSGIAFTCLAVESNNAFWNNTNGNGIYQVANEIVTPVLITSTNFYKVTYQRKGWNSNSCR